LLAGLAYAIAENYFNRVVGPLKIGEAPVFLGGVAKNRAVVAAFEKRVGRPIRVPEHAHVSGAIGAALLAMERSSEKTRFRGFALNPESLAMTSFHCKRCANACLIQAVKQESGDRVFLGSRCERFSRKGVVKERNFFALRQRLLESFNPSNGLKRRVGFPRMGPYYDYWPFFAKLFEAGGVQLVPSNPSSTATLGRAYEANVGDICLPVKIMAGHLSELDESGLEAVFVPGILEHMAHAGEQTGACPYIRALPSLANAYFERPKPLSSRPFQEFYGKKKLTDSLEPVAAFLKLGKRAFQEALEAGLEARRAFGQALAELGTAGLERSERARACRDWPHVQHGRPVRFA